MPSTERYTGGAFAAVWSGVFVAAFAQPHLFSGWGGAAIWSLGAAIQMLMIGFFGARKGFVAGGVLLASVLVANYVSMPGYALACGFILGYVVPGVLYFTQRRLSADCG